MGWVIGLLAGTVVLLGLAIWHKDPHLQLESREPVERERLWIQNPYFIPESDAIGAFAQAVKRGVDGRIMVPSAAVSDMPLSNTAGRCFTRR